MGDVSDLGEDIDASRSSKIALDGPFRGKKGAPITVVEYSDLECPYCKKAHLGMKKELLGTYAGKVQWYFKHFPLVNIHPWAERAAVAAECARRQGTDKFWEMVDLYYDGQELINPGNFREKSLGLAAQAGLDSKAFTFCLDNMETAPAVHRQAEEGEKVDVNSTPIFFINGHVVRGYKDFAPFKQLIDEMLAGKHRPS